MRTRWEDVHRGLVCSLTTLPAIRQFHDLCRRNAVLARFHSATELLTYLAQTEADLDHKDQIYALLVRLAQAGAPCPRLAHALLWCGLWPGLDRIYRRRLRYFAHDPDELTEEISVAFTSLVGRLDLVRVRRVAATLVRSTDRDVMSERRRRPAPSGKRETLEIPSSEFSANEWFGARRTGFSFAGEIAALRARLTPVLGTDADLLLAVLVLGSDQRDAAVWLGIGHDAARKRFQRALRRLRLHLEITPNVRRVSQIAARGRVSCPCAAHAARKGTPT